MKKMYFSFLVLYSFSFNALFSLVPVQISSDGNNCNSHSAINSSSSAEIVWTQGEFPLYNILSSSYIEGAWSTPSIIVKGIVDDAKVGIDAYGNAIAVWTEKISDHFVIRTSSKRKGETWSSAITLSDSKMNFNPKLVMNEKGVAIAAWLDAVSNTISSASLNFGSAWSSSVIVASSASEFDLSLDQSGNGYLIWTTLSHNQINAATSKGAKWGEEECLGSNDHYQNPKICAGALNYALATWNSYFPYSLTSMEYSNGWKLSPEIISKKHSCGYNLSAIENKGFTAWYEHDTGQIHGNIINNHIWTEIPELSFGISDDNPMITMREDGSALMTWIESSKSLLNTVVYSEKEFTENKIFLTPEKNHSEVQMKTSGMFSLVTWKTENHIFANIN